MSRISGNAMPLDWPGYTLAPRISLRKESIDAITFYHYNSLEDGLDRYCVFAISHSGQMLVINTFTDRTVAENYVNNDPQNLLGLTM